MNLGCGCSQSYRNSKINQWKRVMEGRSSKVVRVVIQIDTRGLLRVTKRSEAELYKPIELGCIRSQKSSNKVTQVNTVGFWQLG